MKPGPTLDPLPQLISMEEDMRHQATCALALAAVVLTPTATWAITYGEPDEGAHPNVAALVVVSLDALCSEMDELKDKGVLIASGPMHPRFGGLVLQLP